MKNHSLTDFWPFDRRATHALVGVTALLVAFSFIVYLEFIFAPFFVALMLAYTLNPLVRYGEKFGMPRWVSTAVIYAGFLLLLLFFLTFVVPSVLHETHVIVSKQKLLASSPEQAIAAIRRHIRDIGFLSPTVIDRITVLTREFIDIIDYSRDFMQKAFQIMLQGVIPGLHVVTSMFFNLLLTVFYLSFLMISLDRIWRMIVENIVPFEYKDLFVRLTGDIHKALSAFFRGRLIVSLLVGTITYLGFLLLGVPFAFLLGYGVGFATIVPMLGLIFLFPAMIFHLLVGANGIELLYLVIFYSAVQGLEWLVLTPVILGREVELHPVALVLALLICAYLLGVIGVVLAIPIASTFKILFNEFVYPSFVELSRNSGSRNLTQEEQP
ncbi:MAG: AI-2E family transporter [Planctomycetes bacterium]|nr:AI-2E family transporter [Planctomycetota bacterium]